MESPAGVTETLRSRTSVARGPGASARSRTAPALARLWRIAPWRDAATSPSAQVTRRDAGHSVAKAVTARPAWQRVSCPPTRWDLTWLAQQVAELFIGLGLPT